MSENDEREGNEMPESKWRILSEDERMLIGGLVTAVIVQPIACCAFAVLGFVEAYGDPLLCGIFLAAFVLIALQLRLEERTAFYWWRNDGDWGWKATRGAMTTVCDYASWALTLGGLVGVVWRML